jgi:hypothetical protein
MLCRILVWFAGQSAWGQQPVADSHYFLLYRIEPGEERGRGWREGRLGGGWEEDGRRDEGVRNGERSWEKEEEGLGRWREDGKKERKLGNEEMEMG